MLRNPATSIPIAVDFSKADFRVKSIFESIRVSITESKQS